MQVDAKANTKAFRGQWSLQSCKIIENTKGNQKEAKEGVQSMGGTIRSGT